MTLTRNQQWMLAQVANGNATLAGRPSAMPPEHRRAAIEQCEAAGWLARIPGRGPMRWRLTPAGRELIEPGRVDSPMRVYVPPVAPPRRPGADDWQRLPSMAAGRLR